MLGGTESRPAGLSVPDRGNATAARNDLTGKSSVEISPELEASAQKGAEPEWVTPAHGSAITPEQAHVLLSGTVIFNPNAIPSSGKAVDETTPLEVGQDLQIKWGSTWWAGTILGFESDGRAKVHYFGWASSYDEPKPRDELQLDSSARVKALDSVFKRKGW